jgi:hypothetical protein
MDTAFADRPASGALPRPGALALGGALALAAAFYAGNRRGWEGDDVNLLFGIASLDLVGRDGVYRYGWQPLSYEALAPLARRLANPFDLSDLANALGVAGLVLLVALADSTHTSPRRSPAARPSRWWSIRRCRAASS